MTDPVPLFTGLDGVVYWDAGGRCVRCGGCGSEDVEQREASPGGLAMASCNGCGTDITLIRGAQGQVADGVDAHKLKDRWPY